MLFDTFAHMPFMDRTSGRLIFCASTGAIRHEVPRTAFEVFHDIHPVMPLYQPWAMALSSDLENFDFLEAPFTERGPSKIYCNPVLTGNSLSFVYGRALFQARLDGLKVKDVEVVAHRIFTGFTLPGMTVLGYSHGSPIISVNGLNIPTNFDHVLRIVPQRGGLLITGKLGLEFVTVWSDGKALFRVKAGDKDAYKCCFLENPEQIVHAVRGEGGFEERHLFKSDLHLEPENFVEVGQWQ